VETRWGGGGRIWGTPEAKKVFVAILLWKVIRVGTCIIWGVDWRAYYLLKGGGKGGVNVDMEGKGFYRA